MNIFNSSSVGFSSLRHSVAFVLCVLLREENLYASVTERLRQRGMCIVKRQEIGYGVTLANFQTQT